MSLLEINNIKLKNETFAKYSYTDDWHRRIYEFEDEKKYCLLDDEVFYSITSEYGEPNCPLKDEWQPLKINIYRFDNCQISVSDWEDYFEPVSYDYDDDDMKFLSFEDACKYIEKNLSNKHYDDWDDTAEQADFKPYQHIWSIVEGDSGKLILLNGYRKVNVLDYLVCKTYWGTGEDSDKDVYLEIEYEE